VIPRARFGARYGLARAFHGSSRPDMVAVHHARRRVLVGDVTAQPDVAHLAKTVAYARRLAARLEPPLSGYRVLAQDWYWSLTPEYGRRSWPTSRRIVVRRPSRVTELLPELGEPFAAPRRRAPSRRTTTRAAAVPATSVRAASGRGKYPPYTTPTPAEAATVTQVGRRLSGQIHLPVRADQILVAPWIGRVVTPSGSRRATSEGWRRDANAFWAAYKRFRRDAADLLKGGRRVPPAYAAAMGWPRSTVGQQLVHHHIDNGPYVAAIPASVHTDEPPVHAAWSILGEA
jgi:hypothetical protein